MENTSKTSSELERDDLGRLLPGQSSLNPNGRPKGRTLKEFARDWYMNKSEIEKKEYLEDLEKKKPGFAWEMAEGKAKQDMDIKGEITSKVVAVDE